MATCFSTVPKFSSKKIPRRHKSEGTYPKLHFSSLTTTCNRWIRRRVLLLQGTKRSKTSAMLSISHRIWNTLQEQLRIAWMPRSCSHGSRNLQILRSARLRLRWLSMENLSYFASSTSTSSTQSSTQCWPARLRTTWSRTTFCARSIFWSTMHRLVHKIDQVFKRWQTRPSYT